MAKINEKLVQKNGLDVRTGAFTQGDRVRKQMKAYSAGIFDEVPEFSETSKKKYPVSLIGLRLIKSREDGNAFSQSNIS